MPSSRALLPANRFRKGMPAVSLSYHHDHRLTTGSKFEDLVYFGCGPRRRAATESGSFARIQTLPKLRTPFSFRIGAVKVIMFFILASAPEWLRAQFCFCSPGLEDGAVGRHCTRAGLDFICVRSLVVRRFRMHADLNRFPRSVSLCSFVHPEKKPP